MPNFLFRSAYTAEGARGVIKEGGTSRRAATERAVQSVGGKLESFYFAFGGTDVFLIVDLPDNASAAALNLTNKAAGTASGDSIVLLTPDEIDAAAKKGAAYGPPGG